MNRILLPTLAAAIVPGVAASQAGPAFLVSTSNDVPASGSTPFVDDKDLFLVANGATPAPYLLPGHWQATLGFVPGEIDALGRRPGGPPGSAARYAYSMLSNEHGFSDGDVLGFAPGGGAEVVVAETDLAAGMGVTTTSLDVDALDFDEQGRLLFSLQSDISGTALGTVLDGDVLRLETSGVVTRLYSEADVQAFFDAASGLTSAIADVQGLEWVAGQLLVVVQSPSSHDGAVLLCGATPLFLLDEAQAGLGGEEIDALFAVQAGDNTPNVVVEPQAAAPGTVVQASFRGAPGAVQLVLPAGGAGYLPFAHLPGFGAWYLDPLDPWLGLIRQNRPLPFVVMNGTGGFSTSFPLPTGLHGLDFLGNEGWSFQLIEFPSLRLSAPFRVAKL